MDRAIAALQSRNGDGWQGEQDLDRGSWKAHARASADDAVARGPCGPLAELNPATRNSAIAMSTGTRDITSEFESGSRNMYVEPGRNR